MKRVGRDSPDRRGDGDDLITSAFRLVDGVVELYLGSVVKPFVQAHEKFYSGLNVVLRKVLDDRASTIPEWFTANFITYFRTALVIPTLLLLSWEYNWFSSFLVIAVDFGDFLDGVVARFWIDEQRHRVTTATATSTATKTSSSSLSDKANLSPANSDDESFEVVTTGSPHSVQSWVHIQRNRTYGSFLDAVCDKAYVVPCWILLLSTVKHTSAFQVVQYFVLFWLIVAEVGSACVRFQAYFTTPGVSPPPVEGFDFMTSAVKADHIGKAKQTFEMVGTALFILPWCRYVGLFFLLLAVPLAYESVRRKVKKRVIYVQLGSNSVFDHKTIKFFHMAKGLGSKLIVGIPGTKMTDKVLNACAVTSVDEVVAEAPTKADLMFLERYRIDYVIAAPTQSKFVTDEVIADNRCLSIGEDGVARLMSTKAKVG